MPVVVLCVTFPLVDLDKTYDILPVHRANTNYQLANLNGPDRIFFSCYANQTGI